MSEEHVIIPRFNFFSLFLIFTKNEFITLNLISLTSFLMNLESNNFFMN